MQNQTDYTTMQHDELIGMLNDLININNDRIEGYEKAIEELEEPRDEYAISVFEERIRESELLRNELATSVTQLGGVPSSETTFSGKLYRVWMDVRAAFSNGNEKSILELCEFGEEAAIRAYDNALGKRTAWSEDMFVMLARHRYTILVARDVVTKYRQTLRQMHI